MRLSCNGCRVLRKGCSSDCPIRPCLRWIKSPQSQENATLFLAKFYGRAGLINLINAAAPHLRPASFKSLLEEACGRIVSPILGCSGLLSSGRWDLCEAAVEAVLGGAPIITQLVSSSPSSDDSMLKACDIRHVSNKGKGSSSLLHKVKKPPSNQFKRSGGRGKNKHQLAGVKLELQGCIGTEEWGSGSGSGSGSGLGSGVSHEHTSVGNGNGNGNGGEAADCCSVETVEVDDGDDDHAELELDLDLTLGWGPYNPKPTLDNSHALPSFFRFLN